MLLWTNMSFRRIARQTRQPLSQWECAERPHKGVVVLCVHYKRELCNRAKQKIRPFFRFWRLLPFGAGEGGLNLRPTNHHNEQETLDGGKARAPATATEKLRLCWNHFLTFPHTFVGG